MSNPKYLIARNADKGAVTDSSGAFHVPYLYGRLLGTFAEVRRRCAQVGFSVAEQNEEPTIPIGWTVW